MVQISNNFTTKNYKQGNNRQIKYIVIHYTANDGDTAWENTNYFKSTYRGASAHYFVDEKSIWRCVGDYDIAWHCGAKSYKHKTCRNENSIGIELGSRKDANGNYYFLQETINNAIELVKYLMDKYNISEENVIRHYDVTGKVCPAPFVNSDYAWKSFKETLKPQPIVLTSANDITWELNHSFFPITDTKKFVEELEEAKRDNSSLYWGYYKLVNRIK